MKHNLQKVFSKKILAVSLFIIIISQAKGQTITTYAGNGTAGYSGDGGQATIAELNSPSGVAIDKAGNIYISDEFNNCVRKITPSGTITTIAGNGINGYAGDNGQATAANLNDPTGVALDTAGNIYIADNRNNCIREITISTGIITTIAGTGIPGFSGDNGPATSAKLNAPFDVAVDVSGNVYVSDFNNFRVRKISGGVITTVVGQGTVGYSGDGGAATLAKLSGPEGIALDDSDNIYIADFSNSVIREVTSSTNIINTVAGNGTGQFSGDGGAATAAGLNDPAGVALDAANNIYISDWGNQRIRKVNGGIISTIAGDGSQGYSGDNGPATAASLDKPNGLVVDTAGNTYVADLQNNRIRKITGCAQSLIINPNAPTACSGQSITLIATGGSGYTWSPSTGLNTTTGDTVIATPTATVTYTITSGSGSCGGTTQEILTIVPAPNKPTISISVTGDSLISSAGVGNQWYFNDTLLVDSTRQTLVIKGRPHGWYTVSVINVANGCSSKSDSTTNIADWVIKNAIQLFPNPFSTNLSIQIRSSVSSTNDWTLQLTNVLGQTVYSKQSLNYSNTIDMKAMPDGVYFITVANKNGSATFSVVKQN